MRSLHPRFPSSTPSPRPLSGRLLRVIGLLMTFTLMLTGFSSAPTARAEEARYSPELVLSSGDTIAAGHSYNLTVKGLPDGVERVRIINDPNGLPTATSRNDAGDFELHGRIHVLRPLGSYRWQVEVTADDGYQERFPFEFVVTEPDQFTIKPLITLTPGSLRPRGDFRLSLDNLPAKASYRLTSLAESDPIGLSSGTTTAQGGMVFDGRIPADRQPGSYRWLFEVWTEDAITKIELPYTVTTATDPGQRYHPTITRTPKGVLTPAHDYTIRVAGLPAEVTRVRLLGLGTVIASANSRTDDGAFELTGRIDIRAYVGNHDWEVEARTADGYAETFPMRVTVGEPDRFEIDPTVRIEPLPPATGLTPGSRYNLRLSGLPAGALFELIEYIDDDNFPGGVAVSVAEAGRVSAEGHIERLDAWALFKPGPHHWTLRVWTEKAYAERNIPFTVVAEKPAYDPWVALSRKGRVLHAGVGGINDPAVSIDYQWFRNDKKIRGASARAADYRLRRADRGKWIWAKVTVSKPGYQSVTAKSEALRIRR